MQRYLTLHSRGTAQKARSPSILKLSASYAEAPQSPSPKETPNGLAFGGGAEGFVTAWGRGSATDTHRERIRAWLSSRPEIESVSVGALIDAWHQRHDEHAI